MYDFIQNLICHRRIFLFEVRACGSKLIPRCVVLATAKHENEVFRGH